MLWNGIIKCIFVAYRIILRQWIAEMAKSWLLNRIKWWMYVERAIPMYASYLANPNHKLQRMSKWANLSISCVSLVGGGEGKGRGLMLKYSKWWLKGDLWETKSTWTKRRKKNEYPSPVLQCYSEIHYFSFVRWGAISTHKYTHTHARAQTHITAVTRITLESASA